jgi:hypothetical protein
MVWVVVMVFLLLVGFGVLQAPSRVACVLLHPWRRRERVRKGNI